MSRTNIIKKVIAKLSAAEPEHTYEIPKIPKELEHTTSKRDIEYLKYIKKLIGIISQDPMTGLLHKQHFEQLEKEKGIYLYVDGDGIKKVNDTYGHAAGHAAIEALAAGIKNVLRGKDETKVTRFGGDEFVVHIKDVSIATGVKIAHRILESIQKQKISDHYKGEKSVKDELSDIALGASIGVGNTESEADKALYQAKAKGRNRVEFFK